MHRAHTEGSAPYKLSARAFTNSGSASWALCDARGRTVRQHRTRLSKPAALRYAGEDKKLNAELSRLFISFDPSKIRSCRNMVAFLTCNMSCLPSSHTRAVKKSSNPFFLRADWSVSEGRGGRICARVGGKARHILGRTQNYSDNACALRFLGASELWHCFRGAPTQLCRQRC